MHSPEKREQIACGAPEVASDVGHTVCGQPAGRDRTGARCGQYAPPRFRHANGNVFAEPSFVPSKSRQLPDGRTHTYYCNWQGWYVVRPPRTLLLTSAFSFLY